jgi:hypothetical protein
LLELSASRAEEEERSDERGCDRKEITGPEPSAAAACQLWTTGSSSISGSKQQLQLRGQHAVVCQWWCGWAALPSELLAYTATPSSGHRASSR